MIYVFDPAGSCLERNTVSPAPSPQAFAANHGQGIVLKELASDPHPQAPLASLGLVGGEVVLDPAYEPPQPPQPVDILAEFAALKATLAANLLASPHDRRWLTQKERAKLFGIPWLQSHPEADQADLEAAIQAELAEAFPGEPIVTGAGIIMSYAAEAASRGHIAEASFQALRDLVVGSSQAELQAMLSLL